MIETRETMTWNHNCVFLILWLEGGVWSPPEAEWWEAVRKLQDKRWDLPQRMWRIQNLNQCAGGNDIVQLHDCTHTCAHPIHLADGWEARMKSFQFPSKPLKNTRKNMFVRQSSHVSERRSALFRQIHSDTYTHTHIFPSRLFWTICFLWPFVNVAIMFRCRTK